MQFPARHHLIIYMPQKNTITTDVVFVINGFIIIIIIVSCCSYFCKSGKQPNFTESNTYDAFF